MSNIRFHIGPLDNGQFAVVCEDGFRFCSVQDTEEKAFEVAIEALNFYLKMVENNEAGRQLTLVETPPILRFAERHTYIPVPTSTACA